MAMVCLLQFGISLRIDRRYEPGIGRYYYWMIWYPAAYWLITMCTSIVATPKTILAGSHHKKAIWVSPDRGYQ